MVNALGMTKIRSNLLTESQANILVAIPLTTFREGQVSVGKTTVISWDHSHI